MKDWIKKRIMELNANNVIIFPLRDEDVERKRRNAEIDKELEEKNEEEDDAGKKVQGIFKSILCANTDN